MGRMLAEKHQGFTNPAREVKTPKLAVAKPKGLDENDIVLVHKKSIDRINEKDSFIRQRNQFLFDFLLETGLRAEEIRLLRISQIDEKLEWIKNVRTKGKRYRNVYIPSDLRPIMTIYLKLREETLLKFFPKLSKNTDRSLPLFISTYNADPEQPDSFLMGAKSLWRAINELSSEQKLHPHLLRHSFALDLLNSSNDIRLVAQALGHGDVRVTMRYTERGAEEVAAALEQKKKRKKAKTE